MVWQKNSGTGLRVVGRWSGGRVQDDINSGCTLDGTAAVSLEDEQVLVKRRIGGRRKVADDDGITIGSVLEDGEIEGYKVWLANHQLQEMWYRLGRCRQT